MWSLHQKFAHAFSLNNAAVDDVKWSLQGLCVLSCGFDSSLRLIDVDKGIETQNFEKQVITVTIFHPDNPSLFPSRGSRGFLRLWDIRRGKVVHEYILGLGPILDVEFTVNGR